MESARLASLFDNAIDSFEYVYLGRTFNKNFQISLLQLDITRLRLSRWGQSIGLSPNLDNANVLDRGVVPRELVKRSEMKLGQIMELFTDTERRCAKVNGKAPDNTNLLVCNTETDLDSVGASLHHKIRDHSIKRQNGAPLSKKTGWALYEINQFRRMVKDLGGLISDLEELFPAAQPFRSELCDIEISEIGTGDCLRLLKEIVADQDWNLEVAISKAIKNREGGPLNVTFSGNNNHGLQVGYNYGTMSNLRWGGAGLSG
ncbi:MAG: hypothetical protein M1834_001600 [Cirrosporium novae-zelandiae]|nr:MAG: hypothetical protein M1834_004117 [Cirrosporium novae-zelandiae]KAI9735584.1 MAG: hypothetical protein M1834_001600 [Cirrosporium novae-zelandiae]